MAREGPEGVIVVGKAVCPCTVCLLPSHGTGFKFADLAPHYVSVHVQNKLSSTKDNMSLFRAVACNNSRRVSLSVCLLVRLTIQSSPLGQSHVALRGCGCMRSTHRGFLVGNGEASNYIKKKPVFYSKI